MELVPELVDWVATAIAHARSDQELAQATQAAEDASHRQNEFIGVCLNFVK